jgi:hypothetical protein
LIVLLCCDSRLLSRAYTLLCVRRRRSRTRSSRRHCNGLSTRRSLCATLHFCQCLTWCVAAQHVVDDNARWGLSLWRNAHPSESLVGVSLVDPDRFCLPEDITNTGESRFTRLSLHHLRLPSCACKPCCLIPLSLSDGSWKTLAMKWSKFWRDRTEREVNVHKTKCNEEKDRRRREQEDFELAANLEDNEAATINFINAAGNKKQAAQVRALWLFWFVASPLLLFAAYMGSSTLQQQRRI